MTGEDGGFRAAATRFSAEVEAALTRARRAASEAKAQSAEFRRATGELATQAKTGRLRGVHRGEVAPTAAQASAEAVKFRAANGLPVEELPAAGELIARLPAAPADPPPLEPDDEDYSQHKVLVDIEDEPFDDEPVDDATPQPRGIDSPEAVDPPPEGDEEDFSHQRILADVEEEPYRPGLFEDAVFMPKDEQNPS